MKGIGSILLASAVAGGHYAYYAWPAGWSRSWAQWVGLNILVIVLALLLLPAASRQVGHWRTVALCSVLLAVIESGQAAVCSVWRWGSVPQADLCVETFGPWPYVVASAVLGALYIHGRTKT